MNSKCLITNTVSRGDSLLLFRAGEKLGLTDKFGNQQSLRIKKCCDVCPTTDVLQVEADQWIESLTPCISGTYLDANRRE